jgi:hypothetical protein
MFNDQVEAFLRADLERHTDRGMQAAWTGAVPVASVTLGE